MPADPDLEEVVDETLAEREVDALTPEEYQRLKSAVFGDVFRRIVRADAAYFLLGNYDGGEREARLDLVRRRLAARDGATAFLMREVPDAWEFWPTKFRILAERATTIVPVLEDTAGSHEWELGYVAREPYRSKLFVLKRAYPSVEAEHERFDALPADFLRQLERAGQVATWRTTAELEEAVAAVP